MRRVPQIVAVCLMAVSGLAANTPRPGYESQWQAHLRNGFSIQHRSHEAVGDNTRLWITAGKSYIDVPTDQIVSYEEIEVLLPPVPAVPKTAVAPKVEDLV